MNKQKIAAIFAILLVVYFSVMMLAEILDLRHNPGSNILDSGFHVSHLQPLEIGKGVAPDHRHPYYRSLKRSVILDGSRIDQAVEIIVVLFQDWSRLDSADKTFCVEQLNRVIRYVNRRQFLQILDAWSLCCNDITLFPRALGHNPVFYRELAGRMVNTKEQLAIRASLMANFEIYWLEKVSRAVRQLSEQKEGSLQQWQYLRGLLKRGIRGYYLLAKNSKLREGRLHQLLKRIHFNILGKMLQIANWQDSPSQVADIEQALSDYRDDFHSDEDLRALDEFLRRYEFFDKQFVWVFIIRQQIAFASGNYSQVIRDCEALSEKECLGSQESGRACSQLMMLLADSYIASHLLSSAIPVLGRVEELDPGRLDVGWRMFLVHRVIGLEGQALERFNKRFEDISGSRFLEISSPAAQFKVFILDEQNLELKLSPQALPLLHNSRVVQVMMDGNVVAELPFKEFTNLETIALPLKCDRFSQHHILVNVI